MPHLTDLQNRVLSTAAALTHQANFAGMDKLSYVEGEKLVQDVAAEAKVPVAQVRELLLAASTAATDAAANHLKLLNAEAENLGGSVQRPQVTDAGMSPLGLQLAQGSQELTPRPDFALQSELNAAFHKTAEDFESTRVVVTRRATPKVVAEVAEASGKLLKLFHELDGSRNDLQVKQEIIRVYQDLLADAARDRGVYLAKSTAEHPLSSYQSDATKSRLPGKAHEKGADTVGVGSAVSIDPSTGKPFVFDYHGEVLEIATLGEFVSRRHEQFELDQAADKLAQEPKAIDALRSLSPEGLKRLHGEVEHVTLFEDDKQEIARVYATRWHREAAGVLERRVVVEGPFAGVYLDDLVQELATRRGHGMALDSNMQPKSVTQRHGEPFVTTCQVQERGEKREKLAVRIPEDRSWTRVRRALRRLSELEPAVKYREGSKNTTFVFGPENYKLVRDIVGDLILNGPATSKLQSYFTELTKVEVASSDASLKDHTAHAVGGFKDKLVSKSGEAKPFELSYWQQKSLAWLSARDYKGVIALDTGMGKTLVAIGVMQELAKRTGEAKPFLYVCPPGLEGNIAVEARRFMEPNEAEALLARLTVIDYKHFAKACRTGSYEDKPFAGKEFGGVFFDEAQWIRKRTTVGGEAALKFDNSHKVVLTKSVMKDNVEDVLTLASIANNVDLNGASGKELRYTMRKFRDLYCTVVAGRTVGVKEALELTPGQFVDPKHNMHAFIKANFLWADKRTDDVRLKGFEPRLETMPMPPKMEEDYRAKTVKITKLLQGMVSLYRDKGVKETFVDEKGRTRTVLNPLAKDRRIANVMGQKLAKTIHELNDFCNTPDKIDRARDLVVKHLEASLTSRTVLFSDSPEFVVATAQRLSSAQRGEHALPPGKLHAACLAKEIRLYQDGKLVDTYKPKAYVAADGHTVPAGEWQKYVIDEIIGKNPDVLTTTMLGPVYQEGQNLQWANVGVHLDRDTWSRQNTEQREGRLWRKGQERRVTFYNVDWVFKNPSDSYDRTLDQVRGMQEKVSGDVFKEIIVVPQASLLGGEWQGVRKQKDLMLDTGVLEYAMSPDIAQAAQQGGF